MSAITINRALLATGSALGLVLAAPQTAFAADDQTGANDAVTANGPSYGEIIVTAQKREQKLSDVGLTISAISPDALKDRSIQSLADVAAAVPGLSFINSANNTPVYNLRGVGFYDTSLGSYPTTSVYLDQVPLPFPVLTNLTAFDLERIEVLKGPQGTLFGQNSTGGAINYIAAKPTRELKYGVEASYGRFDDFVGSAYVSGPLSDTVRARIAVKGEKSGPWQYSYTRPNEKNGRNKNIAGRLLIDWDASSKLKFELNLNGWQDQNQPQAVAYSKFNVQAITNVSDAVRNYPFAPTDDPRAADWSADNGMFRNLKFGQASLRGDWEFVEGVALTSITSYVGFTERGALDQDGLNYQDIDLRFFRGNIQSFSQELRLANTDGGPLKWIVGGNFSKDHVFYRENLVYGDGSGGNNQSAPYQIESSENYSDQHMKNYAAFANVEYKVVPDVTLKAGIRYTKAERRADICNVDGSTTRDGGPANRNFPVGGANRLFDLLADLLAPGNDYPDIKPGECFNLNDPSPLNPQANPDRPYEPGLFRSSINEDNVSWRLGVDFKVTPDVLLYANVSKGYKAGGFGNINAAINYQFRPVVQESILAYEGGFKASLANRRVSINGAAFYMDYKNKQLRTKDINPIFGIIDALNNVPKSHLEGGEIEAHVYPVDGLELGAAATYIKSKIDKYSGINAGGVVADFSGSVMPFTPKWQVALNGRYETPVADGIKAFVGAQMNYRSATYAVIGGGIGLADGYEINSFTTVDAQIGIKSDKGWRAMVWGKNLGSTYYWTNVVAGQDQVVRYVQKPATYGVTLGFDF